MREYCFSDICVTTLMLLKELKELKVLKVGNWACRCFYMDLLKSAKVPNVNNISSPPSPAKCGGA